MVITTTPSVEGKKITHYHGIVTGEAIMGANIFRGPVCRRARHHWRSIWRL
jgi:uncharacterized protein YbjQ (UPF0145 family)